MQLIEVGAKDIQDYFCYILLDFAVVDRNLEDAPLAVGILLSKKLGIQPRFSELAKKELKMTKKKFEDLKTLAADLVMKLDEPERLNE